MASVTSFKQQCPSCEAMVPIRDPGLIGRKIDCPKCKYRFLVEEPAEQAEAEEEAPKGKKEAVTAKKPAAKAAPAKSSKEAVSAKKPAKGGKAKKSDDDDDDEEEKSGGSSMT